MRSTGRKTRSTPASLATAAALGVAAAVVAGPIAHANLVTNGSFERTTAGNTSANPSNVTNSNLGGWTISGGNGTPWDFVVNHQPNFVAAHGAAGMYNSYTGLSTFYYNPGPSPDGGNYIAAMPDDGLAGLLSQTLKGLTVGAQYAISFYVGATTEVGFSSGTITGGWQVTFGTDTQNSAQVTTTPYNGNPPPSGGGATWIMDTLVFTAHQTSQVLSFVATDTTAAPPFILLDGVSATQVPEPATLGLTMAGIGGLLVLRRKRRVARTGTERTTLA